MSTIKPQNRSNAVLRFNATSLLAHTLLCALSLSAASAQANPLMILGGINGVVDIVKRTTGSVPTPPKSATKTPVKPKISLPSAHRITRVMHRDAVIALVGEPTQTIAAEGRTGFMRDVYKVKREGSCALDQIEISYAHNDGPVREIVQTCGDVTSNENRSARYAFHLEFPEFVDKLAIKMPRDQVMAIWGEPTETRGSNMSNMFIDAYTVDGEALDVWYDKTEKLARQFYLNKRKVTLPRINRAELFDFADRP